jgi:hypothetical protein
MKRLFIIICVLSALQARAMDTVIRFQDPLKPCIRVKVSVHKPEKIGAFLKKISCPKVKNVVAGLYNTIDSVNDSKILNLFSIERELEPDVAKIVGKHDKLLKCSAKTYGTEIQKAMIVDDSVHVWTQKPNNVAYIKYLQEEFLPSVLQKEPCAHDVQRKFKILQNLYN